MDWGDLLFLVLWIMLVLGLVLLGLWWFHRKPK